MKQSAFLSVRVSPAIRNRIKALAASRGQSMQDFMGKIIEHLLNEQEFRPPNLSLAITCLRKNEVALRQHGIAGLWVFGSVARSVAQANDGIDLLVEFEPCAPPTLIGLASLQKDLTEILSCSVYLAEWNTLEPSVRAQAQNDAVQVF